MRFGRDVSNGDLRIELEPQRGGDDEDDKPRWPAAKTGRDQFEAGYATLDQGETGEYSSKERRGLSPDADYPRRR